MKANYSIFVNLWGQLLFLASAFSPRLSQMDFYFEHLNTMSFPLGEIEYWLLFAAVLGLTSEGLLVWCRVQTCALPLSMAL